MAIPAIVGAAGIAAGLKGFDFGLGQVSSAISSSRAWKYTQRVMQLQHDLAMKAWNEQTRNQFQNTRYSLEEAGYNPLLAVGSQSSATGIMPSATMSSSDNGSGNVSALDVMQTKSNLELQRSQSDVNSSQSALAQEQAKTEQAKRVQMDFQNAMLDVEKHLRQKDLDTYDRRFYANIYEQMQRAENYKAQSAIGMMNAQTNARNAQTAYMNYLVNNRNANTNEYNAITNRYKKSISGSGASFSGSYTGFDFNRYGEDTGRLYGRISNY